MYTVYKHVSPNGKVYIGITSKNPEKRWQKGVSYSKNVHFANAIKKYGWDSFEHTIIADGLTKEQAEQMEIDLIAHYKSNDPEYGYNIASGGHSNSGYHHSEETKRKISESNTGKKRSEQVCKKLSELRRGKKRGRLSDETKRKISEYAKKRGMPRDVIEKARISNTGRKHSDETRLKMSEGKKGHHLSCETKKKISDGNKKKVYQYTKDGDFVKEWDSLKEIQIQLGLSSSLISMACHGKIKSAGGYVWKLANDNSF